MDFDSPDVEKEFPGLYAAEGGSKGSKKDEKPEFSDEQLSKKDLLIGRKKDKKKQLYETLDGSSGDDENKSPSKTKKIKAFKFPSTKSKDKREKSRDKDPERVDQVDGTKDVKAKKEKDKKPVKDKESKKKSKQSIIDDPLELGDAQPIFGVSLGLAVERSRCHDEFGNLPLVVRDCIDYLQEFGLTSDQIYKTEGVKSRLQQLKKLYNNRESAKSELDVPSACSLLKLFLKELLEPILTTDLSARFEEIASLSQVSQQEKELKSLVDQLPNANRLILSWLMVHFDAVTQNEHHNKLNAQALSVLLAPSLEMSHRLFLSILCFCNNLFADTVLLKYIPPITANSTFPETRNDIVGELKKQESLLNQIHAEISAGFVTKKREEQLWEVQRIVTQLKRQLRSFEKKQDSMQKSTEDAIEGDVAINFTLQTKPQSDDDESNMVSNQTNSNNANNSIKMNNNQAASSATVSAVPQVVASPHLQNDLKEQREHKSESDFTNPIKPLEDRLIIADNGFLMLPDNHPDYLSLINLQIENQELMNWKKQLQSRINAERNEIVRLNRLFTTTSNQQQVVGSAPSVDESEYETLVAQLVKENQLLEIKREMLGNELFKEHINLIKLRCQETLLEYSH